MERELRPYLVVHCRGCMESAPFRARRARRESAAHSWQVGIALQDQPRTVFRHCSAIGLAALLCAQVELTGRDESGQGRHLHSNRLRPTRTLGHEKIQGG